ncbi:MAG: ATP-binding protein [Planctomycetota bacterium]|jgi:serine/threonine-protein kinase RsbW
MIDQPAADAWRLSIDLPSERGASRRVTDDLLEHLGIHGWPPSDIFAIHLAAEEAIVNAIVHGNRLDPAKKVHVECVVSPEVTRIAITDEGAGFDPASVPDCTSDERLEAPGGRGVMLMRSFMSRIEYNAKGNGVVLEKIRNPADN